jgi:hypothetical protein
MPPLELKKVVPVELRSVGLDERCSMEKSRVGDNRVDVRLGVEHQHEGLLLIDIFAPLRSDTSGQSRRDPHVSVLSGAISRGFCLCPGVPPRIARSPLPHPHSIVLDGFRRMEAVPGSFGAERQKAPLRTLLEAQPHSSGWVPIIQLLLK